jgi:photosystem II stability/assembly factor-like uncharacterized protein
LAICPTNSQLLLAATSADNFNGRIYRSTDGGGTWSLTPTPQANFINILDVRFQPPTAVPGGIINCIAGTVGNGAYYSTDGGVTWTIATGFPAGAGRVELAYSRSDPSIVYAAVEIANGQLYRSDDGGHSFSRATPGTFGGTGANTHHTSLWVDPTNPDTVVVGGEYMVRSTDRGAHWAEASSAEIHRDHHAIVEDPGYNGGLGDTPNKTVYGGNDGGIHRTNDILASSPPFPSVHWTSLNHDLAITQFYGAAGHLGPPGDKIIGGTQDNGTLVDRHVFNGWTMMAGSLGGDGGFCAADQTIDPYFYGEFFFLKIYRSTSGGDDKQYIYDGIADANHCDETGCYENAIAPFILDPNDQFGKTMLAGGRRLWRSTNVRDRPPSSQPSWAAIKGETQAANELRNISAIAVAPGNSNIIWVGHSDGAIYYTINGMDTDPTWMERDAGLPHGLGHMCTRIAIGSPSSQGVRTVYATFSGFFPSATESKGNLWKTEDNGQTWADRSNGLPSAPMYSVVISPSSPDTIYIGSEVGVFASPNGGMTWSPGNSGPANVPVEELFWMGPKLVAATHGRGIFTIDPADH